MREQLAETVEQIFADLGPPSVVRAAEEGTWPETLWKQLEEAGLLLAMSAEADGGAALGWRDVLPIFVACGRHAAPVPLCEGIAAGALAASAGVALPEGIATLALFEGTSVSGGALSVRARSVPYARKAAWVAGTLAPTASARDEAQFIAQFIVMKAADATVSPDVRLAGEDRCDLEWTGVTPAVRAPLPAETTALEAGAALRTAQLAGGIARARDLALQYACDRKQFGKPIAKFQAIQQQLAVLGEQASASAMAAELACDAEGLALKRMRVACAKARASEAAVAAAAIAHAVHGAIGVTAEHDLQLYTRRLWAWRMDFGSEAYWHEAIGRHTLADRDRPAWQHVIDVSTARAVELP
jgi:acyl-CoA dehydrogenase